MNVLIPEYLKNIDPPIMNKKEWVYEPASDGSAYNLSFDARPENKLWAYNSEMGIWFHNCAILFITPIVNSDNEVDTY